MSNDSAVNWLAVIIGSSVLATAVGAAISALRDNAKTRRDRYSEALARLIAWQEMPYRIRRRPNDEPATLAGLTTAAHELQEKIAVDGFWIASENQRVYDRYDHARRTVFDTYKPVMRAAWLTAPASTPDRMNISDLPNVNCEPINTAFERLTRSLTWRFGLRRFFSPIVSGGYLTGRWFRRWLGHRKKTPDPSTAIAANAAVEPAAPVARDSGSG